MPSPSPSLRADHDASALLLARRLTDPCGDRLHPVAVVLRGAPVQQVAGSLARTGADLPVLATNGRAAPGGRVTGSSAPRILAKCPVPVLYVRIA